MIQQSHLWLSVQKIYAGSKEISFSHVHCSIIPKNQEVDILSVLTMDEQIKSVIYIHLQWNIIQA